MIKFVSKHAPNDRRSVPLDPATVTTINIKPGQVLQQGALPNRYAVKADGASVVGAPLFAFTDSSRKDVQAAKAITVVDGPFVAEINADGIVGSPTLNQALKVGTGGDVGKLTAEATVDSVSKLQGVVAYVTRVADADGYVEVKVIR